MGKMARLKELVDEFERRGGESRGVVVERADIYLDAAAMLREVLEGDDADRFPNGCLVADEFGNEYTVTGRDEFFLRCEREGKAFWLTPDYVKVKKMPEVFDAIRVTYREEGEQEMDMGHDVPLFDSLDYAKTMLQLCNPDGRPRNGRVPRLLCKAEFLKGGVVVSSYESRFKE